MPLNVAMEMRFTKHSDSPLCPAYGVEVRNKQTNKQNPTNLVECWPLVISQAPYRTPGNPPFVHSTAVWAANKRGGSVACEESS